MYNTLEEMETPDIMIMIEKLHRSIHRLLDKYEDPFISEATLISETNRFKDHIEEIYDKMEPEDIYKMKNLEKIGLFILLYQFINKTRLRMNNHTNRQELYNDIYEAHRTFEEEIQHSPIATNYDFRW